VFAMIGYAEEIQPSTQISLTMDEDSQGAHVTQTTTYLNDTGRTQEGLLFALYANLLRRSDTAPYETDAYPAGFTPGGVEFLSVTVDGTPANW
ncbi:hypothetical protein, partial [Klebsiella pneumoniae]|uniref:hypothetical protein n=1 Tax=Klebsiella pneumoniae TaxID=573 RepID=UPI001C8F44E3